jgi:hypothetical protein
MATQNEIIHKIMEFKEAKSPNFDVYMNFYRTKFPEFYNSKLKIFEAKKPEENEDIFEENIQKLPANSNVFNIDNCKKEECSSEGDLSIFKDNKGHEPEIKKIKEKKVISKKFLLIGIALIIIVLIGAGIYFLI